MPTIAPRSTSRRSRPLAAGSRAAVLLAVALLGVACGGSETGGEGGGGAGGTAGRDGAAAVPGARNLLLISIDTLRADALGVYGSQRRATPALDTFAEGSIVFDQAWSHSPKTAPSHMSMFTGLPPRVHGVGNLNTEGAQRLSEAVRTLPEVLRDAGFVTGGFTGGGNAKGSLGFDRGFDHFDDAGEPLDRKIQKVEPWIRRAEEEGQPWFCFLHTYQVHDPYLPPPEYARRYTADDYDGRILSTRQAIRAAIDAGDDLAPRSKGNEKITWNYWFRVDENDPRDLQHLYGLYTAGVAHMDALLGAFLRRLVQAGVTEDTIVVVTSDHGEEFGEHGMVRHEQLWVEVAQVPLIVMLPGQRHGGTRIAETVRHIDLMPSLLELMAVDDPGSTRLGRSWAGWLSSGASDEGELRTVLGEHRSARDTPLDTHSLREGPLLLYDELGDVALYDRSGDPRELHPVERPDERDRLAGLMRTQMQQLDGLAASVGRGQEIELDDAMRAELEALGYLSGDEDGE